MAMIHHAMPLTGGGMLKQHAIIDISGANYSWGGNKSYSTFNIAAQVPDYDKYPCIVYATSISGSLPGVCPAQVYLYGAPEHVTLSVVNGGYTHSIVNARVVQFEFVGESTQPRERTYTGTKTLSSNASFDIDISDMGFKVTAGIVSCNISFNVGGDGRGVIMYPKSVSTSAITMGVDLTNGGPGMSNTNTRTLSYSVTVRGY